MDSVICRLGNSWRARYARNYFSVEATLYVHLLEWNYILIFLWFVKRTNESAKIYSLNVV